MPEISTIIPVDGINNSLDHYNGFDRETAALGGLNLGILQYCHDASSGIVQSISYDKDGAYSILTSQTHFDDGTTALADRTVYIGVASGATSFSYYHSGQLIEHTSASTVQLPDDNVARYVSFNSGGNLDYAEQDARALIVREALVALVLNDPTGDNIVFADERHGNEMSGQTHLRMHKTEGFRWGSAGGELNGMANNATDFTSIDATAYTDEDIRMLIASQTGIPFLYKDGANWTLSSTQDTKLGYNTGTVQYNPIVADVGSLATIGNDYVIMSIWASNNKQWPIVKVIGETLFTTRGNARDYLPSYINSLQLNKVMSPEMAPMFSYIIHNDSTGQIELGADGEIFIDHRFGFPAGRFIGT